MSHIASSDSVEKSSPFVEGFLKIFFCPGPHSCLGYPCMPLEPMHQYNNAIVELSINRKTGTCNDIYVEAQSFSCFDVDNNYEKIDYENTPDIEARRVICYLHSPTVAGIGVAFSVAKLISVVGDIAYNLTLKGINRCPWCFNTLRTFGIDVSMVYYSTSHLFSPSQMLT